MTTWKQPEIEVCISPVSYGHAYLWIPKDNPEYLQEWAKRLNVKSWQWTQVNRVAKLTLPQTLKAVRLGATQVNSEPPQDLDQATQANQSLDQVTQANQRDYYLRNVSTP